MSGEYAGRHRTDAVMAADPAPRKCPTCESPWPALHPAMQDGGEVQPCSDTWHSPWADPPAPEAACTCGTGKSGQCASPRHAV